MAARHYEQSARAEAADRTRMRIVEAVLERLRKAPAEPVAVDRVARMAGVARSTVYAIFGSRAGLFEAATRELYERSGYGALVEAQHEPDAREHLRVAMRAASEMLAANRDIIRALHSMGQLDEQAVGGVVRLQEQERARGMARLARRLAEQGRLREGLSAADAEQTLWVLSSFETFDLLYTGRDMPVAAVTELIVATAERALYAEPYRTGS